MRGAGLQLATHKIEAALLTGKKRKTPVRFQIGSDWMETGEAVKYLGVIVQDSQTFVRHVERVTQKAKRVASALARITPYIGGAGMQAKRCFYKVTESILLYASPN